MSEAANLPYSNLLTKRHISWAVGIFSAVTLTACLAIGPVTPFLASFSPAKEPPAEIAPLPVNVKEIEFVNSITQSRGYTGTVRAKYRSELGFELSGILKSVLVDEGQQVDAGQVLAQLDIQTLSAQLEATQAGLAQAKSILDELQAGPRIETKNAAAANVAAAKSQYDNAAQTFKRRKALRESNAISDEEYQQAESSERTSQANLNAANAQLDELISGTRQEKKSAQESAVKQFESAAKEIKVAIAKSDLQAPFAGTITRRYLDPGTIAQASDPVVKLVQQDNLEAWIGLPVSIAAELETGSEHTILVGGKLGYVGVVSAKIMELDPATRTQTVLFKLRQDQNLDPATRRNAVPGQLCEIQISSIVDSAGCWIETSALTKGVRGLWSVMVIVPEDSGAGYRAEKRDIEIIKTDVNRVLAQGTIQTGDQIIFNGVHRIGEGQRVVPANQ